MSNFTEEIHVAVKEEVKDSLEEAAELGGRSMSSLVRAGVRKEIERMKRYYD